MRISIVGTGYVGLVTGACLAERGHEVVCVDLDPRKVDMIRTGAAPIHEAGLPELLRRHAGSRLQATVDLGEAVRSTDLTMIAVGTPARGGQIDLGQVGQAAREIGAALRGQTRRHAVVVKSTVIPGTTDGLVRQALEEASGLKAGADFGLGMNPEFLTEGTAVQDFSNPDRLVLGALDERTHAALQSLYAGFDAAVPRILTNTRTAEMIKYASNALLATMISFANEVAQLCTAVGDVDALEVMRGVHQSAYLTLPCDGTRRTAPIAAFLEAGCGFGGSCLPKDVTALIGQADGMGLAMPLLRSVLEVNRGQPQELLRLLRRHFPRLEGVPVTVLGLAFKPDTDDLRESPAFPVIAQLRAAGARVTAYDPVAKPPAGALEGVDLAGSLAQAVSGAEAIVLVTRWEQFRELPRVLRELGRDPAVIDGRRLLDPRDYRRYEGVGR